MTTSVDLVDWALAARVGRAVAGRGAAVTKSEAASINRNFADLVTEADSLVRDFTGLHPASPAGEPAVLGRGGWVDVNLEGFRGLLRPVAERLAPRAVSRRLGGAALGIQVGLLLGYVAQKVLGQYDLLLATGGAGRVYFVGPNIVAAERRHGLDPNDFRLWIALHEVTHRTQFVAVDWLTTQVRSLMERYLSGVQLDAGRVKQIVEQVKELIAGGPAAWRRANIVTLFMTGEQRDVIDKMQSLMTVVEGHGNFVMDGVAAKRIPSYERMRAALNEQRNTAGTAERTVQKIIGLDMKYQQYSLGQAFFTDVSERAGMEGVNRVWERPENLPSPEELRDPGAWLERVSPQ